MKVYIISSGLATRCREATLNDLVPKCLVEDRLGNSLLLNHYKHWWWATEIVVVVRRKHKNILQDFAKLNSLSKLKVVEHNEADGNARALLSAFDGPGFVQWSDFTFEETLSEPLEQPQGNTCYYTNSINCRLKFLGQYGIPGLFYLQNTRGLQNYADVAEWALDPANDFDFDYAHTSLIDYGELNGPLAPMAKPHVQRQSIGKHIKYVKIIGAKEQNALYAMNSKLDYVHMDFGYNTIIMPDLAGLGLVQGINAEPLDSMSALLNIYIQQKQKVTSLKTNFSYRNKIKTRLAGTKFLECVSTQVDLLCNTLQDLSFNSLPLEYWHGDLNLENIWVDRSGKYRLIDPKPKNKRVWGYEYGKMLYGFGPWSAFQQGRLDMFYYGKEEYCKLANYLPWDADSWAQLHMISATPLYKNSGPKLAQWMKYCHQSILKL